MTVGIIGAMSVETQKIIDLMTEKSSETISGIEFTRGKIYGTETVCATCGVGKVFAALCAQTMIIKYCPDVIINTGVGGALSDSLMICDTVIADRVCQHDMDTSALGDPKGMISGINEIYFSCDKSICDSLRKAADETGVKTVSGTVASGDRFVCDTEDKNKIRDNFGAMVCEMEGGAIGHVCYVNSTPFCVLRAISDGANDGAPLDFPAFCEIAVENTVKILTQYLKNKRI